MRPELERVLREIEQDMGAGVGERFVKVAAAYFRDSAATDRPVSTRLSPAEMAGRFAAGFGEEGMAVGDVIAKLEHDVVAESNWLYHPRYMGHQVTAPLPAAVWTEPVISTLNQSVAVQEMSPVLTMIEHQLVRWLAGLAGLGPAAGGTLTSGGTEATFTALLAARARALPDAWDEGVSGALPVVLSGEHAHYAVTRAVAQLGLGLKRSVPVRSRDFRMDVADLAQKLAECRAAGTPVMAVVATAGSTPTGSFDDLNAVADLCDGYDVWLHVDGAHGASALLSPTRRDLVSGIGRARSLAWDPHKLMLMPLSVGVVLMRDQVDLDAAFRQSAPYLFAEAEAEAGSRGALTNWDQGGRSFQCSRRGEALKLWVALHRYGTRAFGLLFDHFCDLTAELHALLASHPSFEVFHEPDCNILCFRFIGDGSLSEVQLNELNQRLRTEYNTRGTGWITTTLLGNARVLRTTLMNPRIRSGHLRQMIDELTETAARL